jgi:hypothetical protein
MPDYKEHLEKSKHNDSFVEHLKDTKYIDWRIIGIFYSTLHSAHSCLHRLDEKLKESELKGHLKVIKELSNYNNTLSNNYSSLYVLSRKARYDFIILSEDRVEDAFDLQSKIKTSLGRLLKDVVK